MQFAALLLGGAAQSTLTVDKSIDFYHLEQLELVGAGDVLEVERHQLGAHAVVEYADDLKRIGYRRLAHVDAVAHLDAV